MIVVTGATGKLGKRVVERLVEDVDPSSVVATGRRPEALTELAELGVEVRPLDYDDPASIAAALAGATQVLLVSGVDFGRRVEQHGAVISAAVAAGVEHLAYTSLLRADTSQLMIASEHAATEQLLAEAPIVTTRLRHGWYIENYLDQLDSVLAQEAFVGAAGDGQIAAAARSDYALADAAVLLDRSLWGGTYELAGEPFTMTELAATVSAAVGRDVPYVNLSPEAYGEQLAQAGLPEVLVHTLVNADEGIAAGALLAPSDTLEQLIGRSPLSVGDVLSQTRQQV